jgi:hypothetical protein
MAAITHSRHALGTSATPRPQTAGAVHAAVFKHTFNSALAAAAILELGVLPAFARIVDYKLIPEGNFAGVTASGGIMTGELGADDDARVAGTELFSAATALTAVSRPDKAEAYNVASLGKDRGIGLQFSAQVAADAAKKLTLIVLYAQ